MPPKKPIPELIQPSKRLARIFIGLENLPKEKGKIFDPEFKFYWQEEIAFMGDAARGEGRKRGVFSDGKKNVTKPVDSVNRVC